MKRVKKFFRSKKLVFAHGYMPAELVKRFEHKGKKYVRIAFTNRVKYRGTTPVTDVLLSRVDGIRVLPSPFKVWRFGLIGRKPKAIYYSLKRSK